MSIAEAVLKSLDDAWRDAGKADPNGVLRAGSMTMLVITFADDDPQRLGATLADLMPAHPGRAIVLRLDSRPGATLETRGTIQCWMPFGRRQQICSEQVEVTVPDGAAAEAAGIVSGLIVPDLPVLAWVRRLELIRAPGIGRLLGFANKTILDSTQRPDVLDSLEDLKLFQASAPRLADLAWTRVARWRETLAQVFAAQSCRDRLRDVRKVEIGWAGTGVASVGAYLGAWMKSSFGRLEVDLRCVDSVLPPKGMGRIRLLRISGSEFEVRIERESPTSVRIETGSLHSRLVFPAFDTASLLNAELGVLERDAQFEAALSRLEECANSARGTP